MNEQGNKKAYFLLSDSITGGNAWMFWVEDPEKDITPGDPILEFELTPLEYGILSGLHRTAESAQRSYAEFKEFLFKRAIKE